MPLQATGINAVIGNSANEDTHRHAALAASVVLLQLGA